MGTERQWKGQARIGEAQKDGGAWNLMSTLPACSVLASGKLAHRAVAIQKCPFPQVTHTSPPWHSSLSLIA